MTQSPSTESIAAFERDLHALVMDAFGRGVSVEGTWELAVPVSDAPDWTVTIERTDPITLAYEPEFLEE